jgi:hypothetical protein
MQTAWLNIYRNFDDDTLAALASAGLVRRAAKDVEAGKVAWEAPPGPERGLLRADGQLVGLGAEGPAKASCDCPAPGICKHILAAAIWLRTAAPADDDEHANADALAELLALEPAAIFKAAGVAATRKAGALYAESGAASVTVQAGAVLIALPELDFSCRYIAGAGFAGMVSEAPTASRASLHLLAIAAAWKQQGRDFAWPATVAVAAAPQDDALNEAERQFLDRLRRLILEACASGWAHVSAVMPAQLRSLAMSARVESFPRLAGMLRTLAGTSELLVKRDLSADERQAFRLAARIHALSHALEQASGETLGELRGRARRRFDDNHALELLPLGAHWWEQRSGARGLTISFWDHASLSVMQAALARRDGGDPGFNRANAWAYQSLWPGAGAARTLSAGALALEAVRVSDDNRISLSSETRARVLPQWKASDERWSASGYNDWSTLAEAVRLSAGLRGEALDCVLLKPAMLDAPQLDEVHQIFGWTLRDGHGVPLLLRLSCEAVHHQRIANIEAWKAAGIPILAVLARLNRDLDGGALEPVTLIVEIKGMLRAVALDYEAPPSGAAPSLLNRISRMLQSKAPPAYHTPHSAHKDWIETLQTILENKGMTGRLQLIEEDRQQLLAMQQLLRATGLDHVANAVERYIAAPDASKALMLMHLCQTCAELGTGFIHG